MSQNQQEKRQTCIRPQATNEKKFLNQIKKKLVKTKATISKQIKAN